MVTCIGAVNAICNAISPFSVHMGVRFTDDLIKGATPGLYSALLISSKQILLSHDW